MDKKLRLYISSRDRTSGTDDNFTYTINNLGSLLQDVTHYQVESVTIPKTYYLINSQTNQLIIKEGINPNVTVTIPNGNYATIALLLAQIQTSLNSAGLANTYNVTFDVNTGLVTISRVGILPFEILYPPTSALDSIIGIPPSLLQLPSHTGNKNIYASFKGADKLFVRSYTFSNRTGFGMSAMEANNFSNIIASVVMSDIDFGQVKNYEPILQTKIPINFEAGLSNFDFQLNYSSSFVDSKVDLVNNSWEIQIILYLK